MKTKLMFGLPCVLSLALAACGTSDGGNTDAAPYYPQTDAALPPAVDTAPAIDTTPVVADPYVWVVIQDTEQKACSTNGPGADIDAVAVTNATGGVLGYGKVGTATYSPNPLGNACENTDCAGGNCKYAANGTYFQPGTLPPLTEGLPDAKVSKTKDDSGYFSLNAGTLQIQIGAVDGTGAAIAITSGDYVSVYEVDQTYVTSGDAYPECTCLPEHYTVTLQTAKGAILPLKPVLLDTDNATCAPIDATTTAGCGTTVFMVP